MSILDCDNTRKRAMRIHLDHGSEACVWKDLEDLHSELKSRDGEGGAVFIEGKVMVFTLRHIMTLQFETRKWNTISIGGEKMCKCIPRLLNYNHITMLMRCIMYDKEIQAVNEMIGWSFWYQHSVGTYHILPGTQPFSNISAKVWNSPTVNINDNVTFIKFKESLKFYLLNNTLLINYTK